MLAHKLHLQTSQREVFVVLSDPCPLAVSVSTETESGHPRASVSLPLLAVVAEHCVSVHLPLCPCHVRPHGTSGDFGERMHRDRQVVCKEVHV